jgi:hypothetical protein
MTTLLAIRPVLGCAVLLGFLLLNYFAPLQPLSVLFDIALLGFLIACICLVRPLQIFAISSRRGALLLFVCSLATAAVALLWPAPLRRSSTTASLIDSAMPEYHVQEFHSEMVHATPEHVYRALRKTTFADVKTLAVLMRIRRAAAGHFHASRSPQGSMIDALSKPGSGFVLIEEDPQHEVLVGTGGHFWSTGAASNVLTRDDFHNYREAGSARSVINFKVEDARNGWTRLTTETRVLGIDDSGRRKMAAYWRVIYPGSATIRRMMLKAIKARAEAS